MELILWILGSSFLISLLSFVGMFTFAIKEKLLDKILLGLIAFSAGSLMGGAFLHLLPETIEKTGADLNIFLFLLLGFTSFFILEKYLHWHHHHAKKHKTSVGSPRAFAYLNLIGDGIHNFTDGLIIAVSFVTNIPLGIATTLAVAFHEIPQEIGDFGVLIYGGFSKSKALLYNFICALTIIPGALVGVLFASYIGEVGIFLLPFAAGGFIYIAAADLIPELHKEVKAKKSLAILATFLFGIILMWAMKVFFSE